MRAKFRVFAFLLLAIGLMGGCLQGDDAFSDPTIDVPEEVSGEDVSQPDSNAGAMSEAPTPHTPPVNDGRCGNCDPEWECCVYVSGCFVVSPNGQGCV